MAKGRRLCPEVTVMAWSAREITIFQTDPRSQNPGPQGHGTQELLARGVTPFFTSCFTDTKTAPNVIYNFLFCIINKDPHKDWCILLLGMEKQGERGVGGSLHMGSHSSLGLVSG
jgi:hypothetical protein